MLDQRNSDRRCEAPQGGAITCAASRGRRALANLLQRNGLGVSPEPFDLVEVAQRRMEDVHHHVEGLSQGRWVLLDYVDVVVHIFHPTLRNFYQIERLWADAESVPLQKNR